jgi:hypothetical protein
MIEPLPQRNTKRFQVALSFAGEHRSFVEGVAEHLSRNLGQNRVFYDGYYEAELARPNLDTYLTNLYREDSPFAQSISHIVHFKLPVERRLQPQPT